MYTMLTSFRRRQEPLSVARLTNDVKDLAVTREELLTECFGSPDWPVGDVVLQVRSGEDVLSHLDLYWRTVGVSSLEVPVAAIGQVATDPAYRGLRLASALVRTAHRVAAQRGLEWAALFGVSSLYRRIGYVTPAGAPKPDFLVCPLVDGVEWPAGAIDTRGQW
jgi:predicted N-acetyltransferase YhbS